MHPISASYVVVEKQKDYLREAEAVRQGAQAAETVHTKPARRPMFRWFGRADAPQAAGCG